MIFRRLNALLLRLAILGLIGPLALAALLVMIACTAALLAAAAVAVFAGLVIAAFVYWKKPKNPSGAPPA